LIEEVKYIFKNYISLKYDYINQLKDEELMEGDEKNEEIQEKIVGIRLLNEKYELLIEDKQTQIDVINNFLNDLS
jgi:hypothetical protein